RERALLGLVTLARTAGNTLAARRALDDLASFRSPSESWPMTREWAADLLHRDLPEEALAFLRAHPPGRTPASKTAPDSQDAGSGALDRESAGPDGADGAAGPDGAAWQLLMGSCALRSGDLATARTHIENLFRNPAVVAGGQVSPAKVLLARATLELASDRAARALELLETTDTLDRWRAGELAQARALRGEALLALKRPGDAREELEAGLALAGDWARTRGAADPSAGGSIIGEWLGLHTVSLLARAQLELGQPLAAALTIEGTQSASLRTRAGQLTEEDLLAWAASTDLGLVTWVVGADSGVAVHIAPDGSARGQLLQHGRRSLAEAIRRLRRAALEGQTRRHQILGAQLRDELLPPSALAAMEKATPQAGMRLLFLLHGPLEELPLALLPLGDRPLDDLVTPLVLPGLPAPAPVHAGQLGAKTKVSVTPASFPSGSPAPTPAPGTAPHTHPSPNAEGTNAGDTGAGDTSAGDTSAGDTSAGDTSAEDTSAEDTSAGDTSAEDTSAEDTSAEDTSAGDSAGYPPVPPPGPDTRWILAGNPLVGLSDARPLLPAAADELALLAAELPPATTTIRGENFTRTTLSSALSSSGALHIATHLSSREVCNSPRLAAVGLVLSHGDILCAEEIAALAPRLSLVVLGACETAQGRPVDAEGMLGLARLFLDSGTRNLLATLWPVE
ncbi:MAG: CHAT domain-containing protein, partial [Planctomycetota bacterium]|nr:CHAT domain-containing protein [Planctomycetota bacterium]